ncbi:MAG: hypothetical protein K0S65_5260, partial [Labilithrix sp.]|nr:hypothetical protein [Labilithrix sp.]
GASAAVQEIHARRDECATLTAAAALAVSMAIERELAQLEEHSAAKPSNAPSQPALSTRPSDGEVEEISGSSRGTAPRTRMLGQPRSRPPKPRVLTPERKHGLELRSHATLLLGIGIVPEDTAGARVGASIGRERWSVGLEAGAWLPTEARSPLGGGAGARLVYLVGTACAWHHWLFMCGGWTLGDFRAAGTGPVLSRSTRSTYVAVTGRAGVELPLIAPFSFVLHAGVVAPLVRTTLRIADETLWQAPALGGELGLTWRTIL